MKIINAPLAYPQPNTVIKFHDNSGLSIHETTILNARTATETPRLEQHGFCIAQPNFTCADLYDRKQLQTSVNNLTTFIKHELNSTDNY